MGFFSDLKEDLSQAVSELMPDESAEDAQAESQLLADMVDTLDAENAAVPKAAGEVQNEEDKLLAELFGESDGLVEEPESASDTGVLTEAATDTEALAELFEETENRSEAAGEPDIGSALAEEETAEEMQSEEDKLLADLFSLGEDTGELAAESELEPDAAAAQELAQADGEEPAVLTEDAAKADTAADEAILNSMMQEPAETMQEPEEAEAGAYESAEALAEALHTEAESEPDMIEGSIAEERIPDAAQEDGTEERMPDAAEADKTEESMPDAAENNNIEESVPEAAAETETIKEAEADKMSEEVMEMDGTAVEKEEEKEGAKKMQEQVFDENEVASDEKSMITEGMTITGDIISKGSLEIFGTITGNIDILGKLDVTGVVNGNSKAAEIYAESAKIVGEVNSLGSVKVGQSSVIIGNIMATSAVIAGAVKGDIDVKGPVILDTSAIVMGNIKSKSVQINNGAVVEGMCSQCYADVNPTAFFDEFKKTAKI